MKRLLFGFAGIVLSLVCAFFVWVTGYVVSTEVMPAVRNGSLSVETDSMILNILWEGNEIYILIAAYALAAVAFAVAAVRVIRTAFARRPSEAG